MYIIRNQISGVVGTPFNGGEFLWLDGSRCETLAQHGLARSTDAGVIQEKVYTLVELPTTGTGPVDSVGAPTYNSSNDTVARSHTLTDPALTGAAKTAAVNAEADRRLLLAYPLSEQIWGALRASALLKKKAVDGGNLTAGELATVDGIMTAATFVNAIRASRLALIANGGKTMAQITDDAAWPAQP